MIYIFLFILFLLVSRRTIKNKMICFTICFILVFSLFLIINKTYTGKATNYNHSQLLQTFQDGKYYKTWDDNIVVKVYDNKQNIVTIKEFKIKDIVFEKTTEKPQLIWTVKKYKTNSYEKFWLFHFKTKNTTTNIKLICPENDLLK